MEDVLQPEMWINLNLLMEMQDRNGAFAFSCDLGGTLTLIRWAPIRILRDGNTRSKLHGHRVAWNPVRARSSLQEGSSLSILFKVEI